jgi:hypothetical protein
MDSDNDSSEGEDLFKRQQNNYEQDNKFGSVAPTARLKNPIMLDNIRNIIQQIMKRKMRINEISHLREYINSIPSAKLSYYSDQEIQRYIVQNWLKGYQQLNNEHAIIDTHELLKKNIGLNSENDTVTTSINKAPTTAVISNAVDISSVLGNNDMYGIQRVINPQSLYTKTQILLDTRWRSLDNDGTAFFKWSFSNTMSTQQGTFNTISPVRDIIAIKVFPIKIPYTVNAENPTKNITMYYGEFSNQCVLAQENRKYHHWFDYVKEDDWLTLNADKYNEGVYNFDKPITTLDTLTVSFGAPLQVIRFDVDRMTCTVTSGVTTTLTFSSAHNLDSGYTVYISNYTTTDAAADVTIINAINKSSGLEVTRISSTAVTIAVNSSALVGVSNSPTVYFAEKRIYIPLEITYIRSKS